MQRQKRAVLVALAALAVACGKDTQPAADGSATRDPKGEGTVRSITTSRRDLEAAPPITLREEMRVGASSGPVAEQFTSITHTTFGADGNLYVLDRTDRQVLVADKSGKRVAEFGRSGQGPGELRYPRLLAASADSIIVFEDVKFHIFGPNGASLATRPYVTDHWRNYLGIDATQRTDRGWLVLIRQSNHQAQGEPSRATHDSLMVKPFDPATGIAGTSVLTLPGPETWVLGSAGWIRERYMAASPQFAIALDGTIYSTPGDEYRVTVHAPDGVPLRALTADVQKIPVTTSEFQESLSAEIAEYAKNPGEPGGEMAELLQMLRKEGNKPGHAEHRPILGRIIAARDGALLLERLDLDPHPNEAGDSSHWDYVGRDGRVAGRLVAPPNVFPRLLDGENVFAVVRDENDVPQIVRYRMIR